MYFTTVVCNSAINDNNKLYNNQLSTIVLQVQYNEKINCICNLKKQLNSFYLAAVKKASSQKTTTTTSKNNVCLKVVTTKAKQNTKD